MQNILQSGKVALGCNYWASNAGIYMWRHFDLDAIEKDFKLLSENGLTILRIFPLWNDFQPIKQMSAVFNTFREIRMKDDQPLEGSPLAEAGIDEVMMKRFQQVLDLAEKYNFKVIVALLTGWMSGRMFVPEALNHCNLLTDPLAISWEVRFIKAFIRHFKYHKAIKVWEPGNECNCLSAVENPESAYCWLATITDAIRSADNTREVWGGMHGLSSSFRGNWQLVHQKELCDAVTTHPYPCDFTPHAELDRVDSIRNAFHGVSESNLYRDCSTKDCSIEEAGNLGNMFSAPEVAANYINNMLWNALAHNIKSLLWWCSCDFTHLNYPPYDWNAMERELGLLGKDRKISEQLKAFKKFNDTVNTLDLTGLPDFRRNAVVLLTDEIDHWGVAWASWLLAKQSGFDVTSQSAEMPLKDADFYILPAVTSTAAIPRRHYYQLVEKVRAGATLLATFSGGALEPFEDIFGVKVLRRYTGSKPQTVNFDGENFTVNQMIRLELQATTAEVIARNSNNLPFMTCNQCGKGKAIFMAASPEAFMAKTPGVFADEAEKWYKFYKFAADEAAVERAAYSNDPQITMTEHVYSENKVIAIAVNNTPAERNFTPQTAAGYKVEYLYGKAGSIPANSGVILLLSK